MWRCLRCKVRLRCTCGGLIVHHEVVGVDAADSEAEIPTAAAGLERWLRSGRTRWLIDTVAGGKHASCGSRTVAIVGMRRTIALRRLLFNGVWVVRLQLNLNFTKLHKL
jgi:hypothetical protein